MTKRKIVNGRLKTVDEPNRDYFALVCGDIILLVFAVGINNSDFNLAGIAILSAQLFGYLVSVYMNDRKKLIYLFLSLLPFLISLYLIVWLFLK